MSEESSPRSPSLVFEQDFESDIETIPVLSSQQNQPSDSQQQTQEDDCHQLFKDKRRWKRACSSCQSRKLRCEWESLDHSSTLPCLRCQREKKECTPGQRRNEKRGRKRKGIASDVSVFYHTNKAQTNDKQQSAEGYGNPPFEMRFPANSSASSSDLYWMPTVQPKAHSQSSSTSTIGNQCLDVLPRRISTSSPAYGAALEAWRRSVYVTSGWLTAPEAINYVEYFYEHMAPFALASPMIFHNLDRHAQLVEEETVLAATILTIAARYCPTSRNSTAIHERLWTHLRDMIERFCWGNESVADPCAGVSGWFGNSEDDPGWMCFGETALPALPSWQNAKPKPSSLGLIESLLLLIDWPSRAGTSAPQIGTRCIEEWRDSVSVGNSISRVLVTTARGLARELGVFDDNEEDLSVRARRIRRVLPIYEAQLMPGSDTALNINGLHRHLFGTNSPVCPLAQAEFISKTLLNRTSSEGSAIFLREWIDSAIHTATKKLFQSRRQTSDLVQSGKYVDAVREFDQFFIHWRHALDELNPPSAMKSLLLIDFYHLKIYVNSISLQAAREAKTRDAKQPLPSQNVNPAEIQLGWAAQAVNHNEACMGEIISGCQDTLQILIDISRAENVLRHLPARSFFRVAKGVMFLLETFVLRTKPEEVKASLDLLGVVTKTLRVDVVDDVHLMSQLANLLDLLAATMRRRFWNAEAQETFVITQPVQAPVQTQTEKAPAGEARMGEGPVEEDMASLDEDGSVQTQSTGCTTPDNEGYGAQKMIDLTVISACETVDVDMVSIDFGSADAIQEDVARFHDFILPAR